LSFSGFPHSKLLALCSLITRLFLIIPCTSHSHGVYFASLFYGLVQFTIIHSHRSAWPPEGSTASTHAWRALGTCDLLSGHLVYYTVETKLRLDTSQFEQSLFLFSLPLPSFGGRGFGLRIRRRRGRLCGRSLSPSRLRGKCVSQDILERLISRDVLLRWLVRLNGR